MRIFFLLPAAALLTATAAIAPAAAQRAPAPPAAGAVMGYADLADLVIASPLVIDATIRSATRIKGVEAANLAPGRTRFYVEADVGSLVRGASAIPARVGWLVDVAPDWRGRVPSLKKRRILAFARPVTGQAGQVQLVEPGAQHDWSAPLEQRVRALASELAAPDAPPVVTGVRGAFHVPGALPGEGETQIFLHTRGDRPAALSVLRRPGEQPRWSVALSEIVDDSAPTPQRDTLLWYRLACALPATLPGPSTAALSPDDAAQAQADYRFVIEQLGPCRAPPAPAPAAVPAAPAISAGAGPA